MTYRPEVVEQLTDTQRLAADITQAMTSLQRDWPHMIREGETQAPGMASRSGVLLDDHDPRDNDQNRITKTLSLRRLAQDQLADWCALVIEDKPVTNGATVPCGTDVPGMAAFIARHADWLSGHEAAEDCRDEIQALARDCHQIVNPARKEWMSLGSCPLEVEFDPANGAETCSGDVRAWPRAEDRDGEVEAECQRCGQTAVASWWESQMFANEELKVLLTAAEVVTFIHRAFRKAVDRTTVQRWETRGLITASGVDDKGRKVYNRDTLVWSLQRHIG